MSDLDELLGNVTELAKGRSASRKTPVETPDAQAPMTPLRAKESVPSPVEAARPVGRPVGRPNAPVGERWQDQNKRAAFYLPHEMLERIDAVSNQVGITKSDLVRRALDDWLHDH
jgi:hypothetical protein